MGIDEIKRLLDVNSLFNQKIDEKLAFILSFAEVNRKLLKILHPICTEFVSFVKETEVRRLLVELIKTHKEIYGENEISYDLVFAGLHIQLKKLNKDEEYVLELIKESSGTELDQHIFEVDE